MKKRIRSIIAILCAACMITGITGFAALADETEGAETNETSSVAESSDKSGGSDSAESKTLEGRPWPNSDLYGNWPSKRPGPEESFDLYVNFDFYQKALEKGEKKPMSSLDLADTAAREQILKLCRNEKYNDAEAEILRILYGLFTDTEKRDREGLAPLLARADRVKAAKTTDELASLMQEEGFLMSMPFFQGSVQQSTANPEAVSVMLITGSLLNDLPMKEDASEEELQKGPEKDTESAQKALVRMGYSEEDARRLVKEMVQYDEPFSVNQEMDEEETIWPDKPLVSLQEIRENCFPLYAQLTGVGLVKENAETEPFYELEETDILKIREWFRDENLDVLKAIIVLSLYDDSVKYLDQATWKEESSETDDTDSEQALYHLIKDAAGLVLDQAYLNHFTSKEKWEKALALFDELKEAMHARIENNSWMDDATKAKSLEKLDQIGIVQLDPPGGPFDFEQLRTALRESETLLDAAAQCSFYNNKAVMRFAGQAFSRDNMYLPGTVGVMATNGQYLENLNMINIGAAALNDSMCDDTSRETLLGTLGHHVAHELSHAFDTRGAQRDASGQAPLYTEEIGKIFMEKAASISGKMSRIEILDGIQVNGDHEIGEALADLTGVSIALDLAKKTDDFDYHQFFCSYAKFFLGYSATREGIILDNESNLHPSPCVRINYTVAQFDEFYETYPSVKEGTPMYVAPEDRELIW